MRRRQGAYVVLAGGFGRRPVAVLEFAASAIGAGAASAVVAVPFRSRT